MDKHSEVYEREISLMELLLCCVKKWRWIVASMLIISISAGCYKYLSVINGNQLKRELQEQMGETTEAKVINPNVHYYQLAVEKSEENVKKNNEYLESSVIMQLDANHLQTGILSFHLDFQEEDNETLKAILDSYRTYINSGGLVEQIYEEERNISKSELQYLISFSSNVIDIDYDYSDTFRSSEEKDKQMLLEIMAGGRKTQIEMPLTNQNVFQVRVVALNEELCIDYMDKIEKAVLDYSKILARDLKEHELRLLSAVQTEQMDKNISYYQRQILKEGIMEVKDLRSFQLDLATIQNEEGEYIAVNPASVLENPVSSAVKFAIVGLIMGAFLACFVIILSYIMSNKVQNIDDFEKKFGIKLLGHIKTEFEKKRWFGLVDRWVYTLEEGAYASIPIEEQIKIATANLKAVLSKNEDLKRVMIAGTIAEKETSVICAALADNIDGVEFSSYKQIVFCASALEEVNEYDGILFLEKQGVSASKLIQKELELTLNRKAEVLGAIIL